MQYLILGLGQIQSVIGYVLLSVVFPAALVSRKTNLEVRHIADFRLDQTRLKLHKTFVMLCRVTQRGSHQCNHQFYIDEIISTCFRVLGFPHKN